MIHFRIKGWNHSFSEIHNGEHLMNFNINYHFADFVENDKLFDWNFSATCSNRIPYFSIWRLFAELKSMLVMLFIVHIFVALFICSRIPFVWLLNDFTEVYSYLLMAVYAKYCYNFRTPEVKLSLVARKDQHTIYFQINGKVFQVIRQTTLGSDTLSLHRNQT